MAAASPSVAAQLSFGQVLLALLVLTAIRIVGLHFSMVDLFYDEAQYWSWSRDLALGYYTKPPLLAWVIAGAEHVCGSAEWCVRAPSPLFYAGTTFGLVKTARAVHTTSTLVVTPQVVALPRAAAPGNWPGEGDSGMRTISAAGEDDTTPRTYQDGDSLHQVHWKSTARYGELMVRREEHQWRKGASVFLDTRQCAHAGRGPA